ncbi:MAG: response regulator [Nitrospirae bacterium]|nr:response regulator [Nitrospirota bacterium]
MSISEEEVLLISSDSSTAEAVRKTLGQSGVGLKVKKNIATGVKASRDSQIVLIDSRLSDGDCIDCLRSLNDLNTDLLSIVMTDPGSRRTGIDALMEGAFFYITKPLDRDELMAVLERAFEHKRLRRESARLYQCTVEEFLRRKLKGYFAQIQKVGSIALYETVVSEVEKALLTLAMEKTGGNQLQASKILGLNRNTVRNKIGKYRIKKP